MSVSGKPDYYLQKVHALISKDETTTKKNKAILTTLLDSLCEEMKTDQLFKFMFNRLFYTGSSYEGLRIRKADEFDINLILRLPIEEDEFQLVAERPGHVSYTLMESGRQRLLNTLDGPVVQSLFGLFNKQLKFQPQLLRTWFQGIVDKVLKEYTPPSGVSEVKPRQSGPAKTLYVYLLDRGRIDIDLVPVLEHSYESLPENVPRPEWLDELQLPELDKNWFMVPKNPEDNGDLWRIHFPTAEKKLMKGFKCLKPTIRLLKSLKERHTWPLSSYSLKTVVMHHRLKRPDRKYWLDDNQWTVLLEVLKRLQEGLLADGPGISSLFDEEVSLIQGISVVTKMNIASRLKRIVYSMPTNPERTFEFFLGSYSPDICESSPVICESSPVICKSSPVICESSPVICESSSTVTYEGMVGQLSSLSLSAGDVSFGETSADSGVDSRDSSFANGTLDVSLGNQIYLPADCKQEAGIIVSRKLELVNENATIDLIKVTLSVLVSDGRLLGETSTSLHSCVDEMLVVPLGKLTDVTATSLLVVRLCLEAVGKAAASSIEVTSMLSVMTSKGRQLANSRFHLRVCNRVEQCELRLPFPQIE